MSSFRIALANIRYPETPGESVAFAVRAIDEASTAGADLICFPECYVPGYRGLGKTPPPPDAQFLAQAWETIAQAAGEGDIAVVLGTERFIEGALRISALVIDRDGSVAGFQDKVQLDPSEESTFTPGSGRHVFAVGNVKFGVVICHEGWRYPETVRAAVRGGAQIVFHPHYDVHEAGAHLPSTFADPENTFHEKAALCRAAENTCYFATVNCASENSPTTSAVINPDGTVLAYQPYGKEGLLIADIELSAATGFLASRCRTA